MRTALPLFISAITLLNTFTATAQNDRFAYAVTDQAKDGGGWNVLRKLDLQTGEYSNILLNGIDEKAVVFNAATKKQMALQADPQYGNLLQVPFGTGVAAMAYDKKHNRLYYTPMFIDQLRYIDLNTMKVYYITDQAFTKFGNMQSDEAKIITRMVIAPDGNGYAITNDGAAFIKFSTAKKTSITQLGTLVDDPSNKGVSIHNRCSGWGGDMIADDAGNLLIITAPNHVFKVEIETKVATHLGTIKDLPTGFTVNGAVVDPTGALLVSSAVNSSSYYTVDTKSLKAKPYVTASGVFRSSDLANSNYLCNHKNGDFIETIARPDVHVMNAIRLYPNPVTTRKFNVQFSKIKGGDYTLELTNALGQKILQRRINVSGENQTQEVRVNSLQSKGIYLVKVFDITNQSVFEQKVMLQ